MAEAPELTLPERIRALLQQLNRDLYEKEELISLALLSAMAGESIFLLGPPGVAKSMIARRLKFAFSEARAFEYLMGKFSTPDEVFGPVSISKLKNEDRYERLTTNYLPGAQIVFLDEIWKASPPIQNALLTVLNEKIYRNGEQEFRVDIRGLISASNELPLPGEGLEALWDRFLIRKVVVNIADEGLFADLLQLTGNTSYTDPVSSTLKISDEEYIDWKGKISTVDLPDHIVGLFRFLRRSIRERNQVVDPEAQMYVSDRRWMKIARLLRAAAFLNGRNEVHVIDCFLIADCIWDDIGQIQEAEDLVLGAIASNGYRGVVNLGPIRHELNELQQTVKDGTQLVKMVKEWIPKQHVDAAGQRYVAIKHFWGESSAFMRLEDFEKLDPEKAVFYPLFEATQKNYHPFQNYSMQASGELLKVLHKERLMELEAEEIEREVIEKKTPSAAMVRLWDNQVTLLLEMIEEGIKALEQRKLSDEPFLLNHLFSPMEKGTHVLDSLNAVTDELLGLKLEVEKTHHSYATLEQD